MQGFEGEVEQSGFEFLEPQEKDGILDQYLQRLRYECNSMTQFIFS